MMRTLTVSLLIGLVTAVGCGGKDKGATTTSGATGQTGSGNEGGDAHEGLPAEMQAFHDLLAPRWHAAAGAQRITDTCGAVPQFKSSADAIAVATPPIAANADTWTTGTKALVAAVGELNAACKTNDAAKFEPAFAKVHDAFHALMEQGKMHGDGDQQGSGGMHHAGSANGTAGSTGAGSAGSAAGSGHEHGQDHHH